MTDRSEDTPNEILAVARQAKQHEASSADRPRRLPLVKIGVGVGIGSAAIAAALLYANRSRNKRDR